MKLPDEYPFALLPFAADIRAIPQAACTYAPVCSSSVNAFISDSKLNAETISAMQALRNLNASSPLPIARFRNALRFIASTQNAFRGGVAEAIDRAVCHFILPHYLFSGIRKEELAQYLTDMPRALDIWNTAK